MAQLRQDWDLFEQRDAVILVVGPEDRDAFRRYWDAHDLPFYGLPDPNHSVADLYEQEVSLLKLGRMPALIVIDKRGGIRYRHYGSSMADIPDNGEIFQLLESLNQEVET